MHRTDDSLTAGVNVNMLDRDLLLTLTPIPLQRFDLHCERP